MYIHFEVVTAYKTNISKVICNSREAALKVDFSYACEFVEAASLDEIKEAAMSGKGKLHEAIRFLGECSEDMRDVAERENVDDAEAEGNLS